MQDCCCSSRVCPRNVAIVGLLRLGVVSETSGLLHLVRDSPRSKTEACSTSAPRPGAPCRGSARYRTRRAALMPAQVPAAPQGRLENQGLVRSRPTLALALTACAGVACAISLNPYCLCRAGWSRCMRRRRSRTTRSGAGQGISGLPMRRSANPWSVDQSMIATKDASPPGRAPASMQRWTDSTRAKNDLAPGWGRSVTPILAGPIEAALNRTR